MSWKTVYKTENIQRAEMVKSILEDKGCNPIIINKKDSAYLLGLLEIQVSENELLKAIHEIEKINFE